MTTTATSVLNNATDRAIQREVSQNQTFAGLFANTSKQGVYDRGRLYASSRLSIGNAESDFTPADFNPVAENVAIPSRTNAYLTSEALNNFAWFGENIGWDLFHRWFSTTEFPPEVRRRQTEAMRQHYDRTLFEQYRANGGTPTFVGTTNADYMSATGDVNGAVTKEALFIQIRAFRKWLIGKGVAEGATPERPLHWVCHPYFIENGMDFLEAANRFYPSLNERIFRDARLSGQPGYAGTYRGVNMWESLNTPEFTPSGGTNNGKKNWTSFGFVGRISFLRVDGPTIGIDRGPAQLGTLNEERFVALGLMVDTDAPGLQYVTHTRKEA